MLFIALPSWAEVSVPTLSRPVTDLTGTLSAAEISAIEAQIQQLEATKGSQIAVLIVATTMPEVIEQYAIRVVDQWKLGREGIDDGVLLLVAKDDRKLRIEVGYGLEGVIPDAIAKRVIAETITPKFKQQQFADGISAGVGQLAKLIDGEPLPPSSKRRQQSAESFDSYIPMIFFTLVFLGPVMRSIFGRILGAVATGGLAGFGFWAITAALFGSSLVGIIVFLLVLLFSGGGRSSFPGGPRGGYGGGFGGSWPSGGGGFGGGGWSGGGGGFGGGGASGGW
ncbi:MAG TPA: hypothetical protein DD827_11530 [Gammaproteobacteria bacterium]|nr:hypothetical protein [Gammaproteobacteria bacterium]